MYFYVLLCRLCDSLLVLCRVCCQITLNPDWNTCTLQMSDTKEPEGGVHRHPFLIISPGSVLYNWMEELDTWGYFTVR